MKQKNPKKVSAVDALLTKYRGREHGVYTKVCAKYGIKPKPEWTPDTTAKPPTSKSKKENIKDKLKSLSKNPKKPARPTSSRPRPQSGRSSNISKSTKSKIQSATKPIREAAPNISQSNPSLASHSKSSSKSIANTVTKQQQVKDGKRSSSSLGSKQKQKLSVLNDKKRIQKYVNKIRQPPKSIKKSLIPTKSKPAPLRKEESSESEDDYDDDFEV